MSDEDKLFVKILVNGSLRHLSAERQFSYRKLKNQTAEGATAKALPLRPPPPILVDVAPPEVVLLRRPDSSANVVSLLDEPIDAPQEGAFEGTQNCSFDANCF